MYSSIIFASVLSPKYFTKQLSVKLEFLKVFSKHFLLLLTTSLDLMQMHVNQHLVALDNHVCYLSSPRNSTTIYPKPAMHSTICLGQQTKSLAYTIAFITIGFYFSLSSFFMTEVAPIGLITLHPSPSIIYHLGVDSTTWTTLGKRLVH